MNLSPPSQSGVTHVECEERSERRVVALARCGDGGDGDRAAPSPGAAGRATVQTYLEENLSPARAARRLGIHQNTVVYRVKQTEELLGHAIEQRRLPLEVALRLSDMIEGLRTAADGRRPARG